MTGLKILGDIFPPRLLSDDLKNPIQIHFVHQDIRYYDPYTSNLLEIHSIGPGVRYTFESKYFIGKYKVNGRKALYTSKVFEATLMRLIRYETNTKLEF